MQQPIFSHRGAATATEPPKDEPEDISDSVQTEEAAAQPKPAIDVPPISKIAPKLDSYAAPPGVLAALPGARRIAPELAHQLGDSLNELRALRDRMQNH